jgi:hypothetical protein
MTTQNQLWQNPEQTLIYTELCNTLYERELARLAQTPVEQHLLLTRRLKSLSFYVREAASLILQYPSPLQLDSQNACWLHSQSRQCPVPHVDASASIFSFYAKFARLGLLVPIYQQEQGVQQISLDSVDEIDHAGQRLHCNEHGWFAMAGWPQEPDNQQKLLLKPSKAIFTAVCCGHQWRNGDKKSPRLLSLREMLLASRLNWLQLAKPHPAKSAPLAPKVR